MSEHADDDNKPGYGLVMPFVSVQSKGGPHDDAAYAAGYAMGLLDAQLGGSIFDQGRAVRIEDQGQADLIAMRHGFVAEFTEEQVEGWVCMILRRAVADPEMPR